MGGALQGGDGRRAPEEPVVAARAHRGEARADQGDADRVRDCRRRRSRSSACSDGHGRRRAAARGRRGTGAAPHRDRQPRHRAPRAARPRPLGRGAAEARRRARRDGRLLRLPRRRRASATTRAACSGPTWSSSCRAARASSSTRRCRSSAYLDAVNCDDVERSARTSRATPRRCATTSGSSAQKRYWRQFEPSPEFVVMFVDEGLYRAALDQDGSLFEAGAESGVIVASPATLIGAAAHRRLRLAAGDGRRERPRDLEPRPRALRPARRLRRPLREGRPRPRHGRRRVQPGGQLVRDAPARHRAEVPGARRHERRAAGDEARSSGEPSVLSAPGGRRPPARRRRRRLSQEHSGPPRRRLLSVTKVTYSRGAPLSDQNVRELIIIGGGPAGYTAALYAARADLEPLVIEGFAWGGQLMITSDVENYPGYADGIMGPEMMSDFRRQAERFGAEFITDDVTSVDFSEQPFRVWVGDDEYAARGRDRRDRRERPLARDRVGGAAQGPRRLGLRDLRRVVLPREGRLRRRRRRLGVRGGALPDEVRHARAPRAPARRVPRLEDHGRPRRGERQARLRPERRVVEEILGDVKVEGLRLRSTETGETWEVAGRRPVRRDRPRPEHGALRRPARPRRRPATWSRSRARPRRTSPASSPPATSRTTPTARRSPPPARAVWRRSTRSGSSPRSRAIAAGHGAKPPRSEARGVS